MAYLKIKTTETERKDLQNRIKENFPFVMNDENDMNNYEDEYTKHYSDY